MVATLVQAVVVAGDAQGPVDGLPVAALPSGGVPLLRVRGEVVHLVHDAHHSHDLKEMCQSVTVIADGK